MTTAPLARTKPLQELADRRAVLEEQRVELTDNLEAARAELVEIRPRLAAARQTYDKARRLGERTAGLLEGETFITNTPVAAVAREEEDAIRLERSRVQRRISDLTLRLDLLAIDLRDVDREERRALVLQSELEGVDTSPTASPTFKGFARASLGFLGRPRPKPRVTLPDGSRAWEGE